ncbi:flagellar protein FlgN [Pseudomonas profundi]|uniref:flagellar protein FlgN n=1 Tax=Pseudomonas profundi TaxID=1981513 RepID=UPI001238D01F|nr:flagellar protein FlgN [Pseudomonas profundi]
MNAERLQAALEHDLGQDCVAYTSLLRFGEALHACLLERDSPRVEATNRAITGLLEQVAGRAQRRNRILGAFSLSASERGMQKLIASCEMPMRKRLEASWSELGRLVRACQQQNERNGKLLAMQQDILNHLLDQGSQSTIYAPQYY